MTDTHTRTQTNTAHQQVQTRSFEQSNTVSVLAFAISSFIQHRTTASHTCHTFQCILVGLRCQLYDPLIRKTVPNPFFDEVPASQSLVAPTHVLGCRLVVVRLLALLATTPPHLLPHHPEHKMQLLSLQQTSRSRCSVRNGITSPGSPGSDADSTINTSFAPSILASRLGRSIYSSAGAAGSSLCLSALASTRPACPNRVQCRVYRLEQSFQTPTSYRSQVIRFPAVTRIMSC